MGLGKTIQVIALLARLGEKNVKGPFLIVAPLATLPNWMNELKKWLPSVPCALYHGAKDGRRDVWAKQFRACASKGTVVTPIMVTSYEVEVTWCIRIKDWFPSTTTLQRPPPDAPDTPRLVPRRCTRRARASASRPSARAGLCQRVCHVVSCGVTWCRAGLSRAS